MANPYVQMGLAQGLTNLVQQRDAASDRAYQRKTRAEDRAHQKKTRAREGEIQDLKLGTMRQEAATTRQQNEGLQALRAFAVSGDPAPMTEVFKKYGGGDVTFQRQGDKYVMEGVRPDGKKYSGTLTEEQVAEGFIGWFDPKGTLLAQMKHRREIEQQAAKPRDRWTSMAGGVALLNRETGETRPGVDPSRVRGGEGSAALQHQQWQIDQLVQSGFPRDVASRLVIVGGTIEKNDILEAIERQKQYRDKNMFQGQPGYRTDAQIEQGVLGMVRRIQNEQLFTPPNDPGHYDPGHYDPGHYDPGHYDPGQSRRGAGQPRGAGTPRMGSPGLDSVNPQGTPRPSSAGATGSPSPAPPTVTGSIPEGGTPQITTKAEYDQLPSGSYYFDPEGTLRVKP